MHIKKNTLLRGFVPVVTQVPWEAQVLLELAPMSVMAPDTLLPTLLQERFCIFRSKPFSMF